MNKSRLPCWLAIVCLPGTICLAWGSEPSEHIVDKWSEKAHAPPGTRQVLHKGKLWPPFPRPSGPKQHWIHQYHHAHYWPYPYNEQDEAYWRAIIDQQTANGWVQATTLQDYHFDPETQQLNSAGRKVLLWVLTQAPAKYRTIYISQGESRQVGEVRLAQVKKTIQEMELDEGAPLVSRPGVTPLGRPAEEIEHLRRLEINTMPRPRLFVVGTGNRGSGSNVGSGSNQQQGGGITGSSGYGGGMNR